MFTRCVITIGLAATLAFAPLEAGNGRAKLRLSPRKVVNCAILLVGAATATWFVSEFYYNWSDKDEQQLVQKYGDRDAKELSEVKESRHFIKREGVVVVDRWIVGRAVYEYDLQLGDQFKQAREALKPGDHLIDSGCGEGCFLDQYRFTGGVAFGTGITFEKHSWVGDGYPDKLRFLVGRFLEDIPVSEILGSKGDAELIADQHGPFNYSPYPNEVLSIYQQLMDEPKDTNTGKTFIRLSNRSTIEIDGKEMDLVDWLVTLNKPGQKPVFERYGYMVIMNEVDDFSIPDLELVEYNRFYQPPYRKYRIRNKQK